MNKINVSLDVAIIKEADYYIAYAHALELTAYGKTIKSAKKDFEQVLEIFFEETTDTNTIFDVLLELGWTLKRFPNPHFTPPQVKRKLLKRLNLPSTKLIRTSQQSVMIPVS